MQERQPERESRRGASQDGEEEQQGRHCGRRDRGRSRRACTPAGPKPEQIADAIYVGGDIVTIDDKLPTAEALAVKDGKIVRSAARPMPRRPIKGATTKVIDLGGKTLMPSFIDAHSHYINSLLVANQGKLYAPPAGPGKDVESIVAALKKFAEERKIPKGEEIVGYGYDDTRNAQRPAAQPRRPRRRLPGQSGAVDHVSMHGNVMNSLALKKYGISAATKTPPGGVIVRKPGTNEPMA